MSFFIVGLLACWQGRFGCHRNGDIWMVVPHCLMWYIWKERNSRCFEDKERSMPDLKLLFFRTLLDWFFVWRNHHFSSILDFLDFCNVRFWFVLPCGVLGCLSLFDINEFLLLIKKKILINLNKTSKWRTIKLVKCRTMLVIVCHLLN